MQNQIYHKLELTEQELAKVKLARQRDEATKVEPEWMVIAELGLNYGWEAIVSVRSDSSFTTEELNMLNAAARKVHYARLYEHANAVFYASVAARSKRPFHNFKRLMKDILNNSKADNV